VVWRDNSNLVGLCGEWCYAVLTGQDDKWTPERFYDGGVDFPGVNVKASASQNHRHLLANVYGGLATPFYFGVTVDLDRRLAHPLGYATRGQMERGAGANLGTGRRQGVLVTELLSGDELLAMALRHPEQFAAQLTQPTRRENHV
jgi:hypothetical protein